MIRHSSLTIGETLQTLDDLGKEDQEDVLKIYLGNSAVLSRFLNWYIHVDISSLSEKLDYKLEANPWTMLSKNLTSLEKLPSYSETNQIKFLNELLATIPATEMMLMENVITRNLKDYYPNIDWVMVAKYFPGI